MSNEELPQWLQEIGRRPVPHNSGRPVPPISGAIRKEQELDERAAVRLEQDFRAVIESCTEDQEQAVNGQVLDAMTGNRLSSAQAYRLLSSLFRRFDGCQGISRIDADGNPQPLNRWGAA
jgi:hypothetical protein